MRYFIVVAFLFTTFGRLSAQQNKYALLIGINKYQIKDTNGNTVLDPKNALNGCVNDAESMRKLLISKFDFNPKNITTLYDTVASRNNIFKQIDALRAKCKKGDVAVVYYAGHGMTFKYGNGSDETAEVILPSNGFVTVPFSYIEQSELAEKFNTFVDNDITLTAIFDCCFSLATGKEGPMMNIPVISPFDSVKIDPRAKDDDSDWVEPVEATDADEYKLLAKWKDTLITDNTTPLNLKWDIIKNRGLDLLQYKEMTKNVLPYGFKKADITFNPPSQRENSRFVFISSTNDKQTAPETRGKDGVSHGLFTLMLTKLYDVNPAKISLTDIFYKTVTQLKTAGITPSARYKPNVREDKNIFGINTADLKLMVYLPAETTTVKDLNAMYKKWGKPLNTDEYKAQTLSQNNPACSKVYIINGGTSVFYIDGKTNAGRKISNVDTLKKYIKDQPYLLYFPVPKTVNDSIKKACSKNNKIVFVNDMNIADVSIYCTNYAPDKKGFVNSVKNVGRNLTDAMIDYDYRDKLSFVTSDETIGAKRNKAGHYFSATEDLTIAADEAIDSIAKKIAVWFGKKAGK